MNTFLLCFLIIIVRIIETSMATIRMIFTIKNNKVVATLIAFFEILIWFLIVKKAINTTANNILVAVCYALGFALGTLVGMNINEKRVLTNLMITIVINKNQKQIYKLLTTNKFAFSMLNANGKDLKNNKNILFVVTNNKRLKKLQKILLDNDEKALIITNEPKNIFNGFI